MKNLKTNFLILMLIAGVVLTIKGGNPVNAQTKMTDTQLTTNSLILDAPTRTVWKLLSSPGHLEKIHSYVKTNTAAKWSGIDSVDTLVYDSGLVFERRVTDWKKNEGFDLTVVNKTDSSQPEVAAVSFRIAEAGKNKSKLTVTVRPAFPPALPIEKRREIFDWQLKPGIDKYFTSLLEGTNHYLTTGKPVTENQFGGVFEPYSAKVE